MNCKVASIAPKGSLFRETLECAMELADRELNGAILILPNAPGFMVVYDSEDGARALGTIELAKQRILLEEIQ